MIRHSILINTDYKNGKTGDKKKSLKPISKSNDYISTVKTSDAIEEINEKFFVTSYLVKLFLTAGSIGYMMISLELKALFLLTLTGIILKSIQMESWWFFGSCILVLAIVLWAIGQLPDKAKDFFKVLYFRIHTLLFMGILGSGGYFLAKKMGIMDVKYVAVFSFLTIVPATITHSPFFRKENILRI